MQQIYLYPCFRGKGTSAKIPLWKLPFASLQFKTFIVANLASIFVFLWRLTVPETAGS